MAELLAMGFKQHEARSALLACAKDVGAAAGCVLQRRGAAEARVKAEGDKRRRLLEMKSYGLTPRGKPLDAHALEQLEGLGYVRPLAAEALRQAENDLNEALSGLSSAVRQEALQLAVMQRAQHGTPHVPQPEAVFSLEAMGFGADAARRALVVTHGDVAAAATKLAAEGGGDGGGGGGGGGGDNVPFTADAIAAAVSAAATAAAAAASSSSAAAPAPVPHGSEGVDTAERARIDESGLQHAVRCAVTK